MYMYSVSGVHVREYVWYWPHATSHSHVSTGKYARKMGEALHDTARVCAHQSLCATEFHACTCV